MMGCYLYLMDYKPKFNEEQLTGTSSLVEHFESFSERIGIEFKAPESFVNLLGSYLASVDSTSQALEYYQLNVKNYPSSWRAHDNLASFYLAQGDTTMAIEHTRISLDLNPENEEGSERFHALNDN